MDLREEVRVAWGTGIAGFVAESGVAVNIPDAYQVSPGLCSCCFHPVGRWFRTSFTSANKNWCLAVRRIQFNQALCNLSWTALSAAESGAQGWKPNSSAAMILNFPWTAELIDWCKGKSHKSVEWLSTGTKTRSSRWWWWVSADDNEENYLLDETAESRLFQSTRGKSFLRKAFKKNSKRLKTKTSASGGRQAHASWFMSLCDRNW